MKKIALLLNSSWNAIKFRSDLISALESNKYEVIVISPADAYSDKLKDLNCKFIPIQCKSNGLNPFLDIYYFLQLILFFRSINPDVILSFTIKPNIYGSVACALLKIPCINNVTGLGSTFIRGGILQKIIFILYKISFKRSSKVFFQNVDDLNLFINKGIISTIKCGLLPGSGINTNTLKYSPYLKNNRTKFLFISRLIRDKGVEEYVEAARAILSSGIKADFNIVGFLDVQNPTAITRERMDKWVKEGVISYLGHANNVEKLIATADCIVLPSYREGTPRILLEAAAVGRPIITTNVPGCKNIVDNGINGILCKVRNSTDLANKMKIFLNMPFKKRKLLGINGREKVETEYDVKIIIYKYLEAINHI